MSRLGLQSALIYLYSCSWAREALQTGESGHLSRFELAERDHAVLGELFEHQSARVERFAQMVHQKRTRHVRLQYPLLSACKMGAVWTRYWDDFSAGHFDPGPTVFEESVNFGDYVEQATDRSPEASDLAVRDIARLERARLCARFARRHKTANMVISAQTLPTLSATIRIQLGARLCSLLHTPATLVAWSQGDGGLPPSTSDEGVHVLVCCINRVENPVATLRISPVLASLLALADGRTPLAGILGQLPEIASDRSEVDSLLRVVSELANLGAIIVS